VVEQSGTRPEEWLGAVDGVTLFRQTMDEALRRLAVEVAALRAERDGLRLELEAIRAQLELARIEPVFAPLPPRAAPEPAPVRREVIDSVSVVAPIGSLLDVPGVSIGALPAARRPGGWGRRITTALATAGVVGVAAVTVGPLVLPYQTSVVRSGSMAPAIHTGELIVVTQAAAARVRAGDVITFERPGDSGTLITHRVDAFEDGPDGPRIVTKGDANQSPDPWRLPVTGTFWRYRFGIPVVGYAFAALATPLARVALVAVPVGFLALSFLRRRRAS